MRRSVGIGVSVVTAAWVVLGMWTPSASALAPDTQPISFVGHGVVDCGAFVDAFDDFFNGFETIYFDQAGNPIRDVLNLEHHSNDSNSLTGLVVHEHGHFTLSFDLLTGTATFTGNQEIITRPGMGVVLQDVGRIVFDVDGDIIFFAGGLFHSQELQGEQIFCEALA